MEHGTNPGPIDGEILDTVKPSPLASSGGRIEPDVLYKTAEAAHVLGISLRSLERWRKEGRGPKVTRLYSNAPPRYRGADLLAALENSREA
ncbi:helix-turn-helix domain-containing protein [Ruegeria sp. HKCCD9179]|uniref:helix-turn-helix domain-containing protein n=1 Tax=Ruegeria sp. HKCCD9179 TaxID=2683016 RepID=UPI0020C237F3|nr:helix-turn-helix domain-containing protein [Ruegeria sp. HKCCD9179]